MRLYIKKIEGIKFFINQGGGWSSIIIVHEDNRTCLYKALDENHILRGPYQDRTKMMDTHVRKYLKEVKALYEIKYNNN